MAARTLQIAPAESKLSGAGHGGISSMSDAAYKRCPRCGETKRNIEFHRNRSHNDGLAGWCKECNYESKRQWRARNPGYAKAYAKTYKRDPETVRERRIRWRAENPQRTFAHNRVNRALRDGKLTKPKRCAFCGAEGRIEGHHEDYGKPLEVIWLCNHCHRDVHRGTAA